MTTSPHLVTSRLLDQNGKALDSRFKFEYLDVRQAVNRISSAEIAFIDGLPDQQNFQLAAEAALAIGQQLSLELGYSNNQQLVFSGIIVEQRIKVKRDGSTRLLIGCRDKCFRMTLVQRSEHHDQLSENQLFGKLAERHQLTANAIKTDVHRSLVQYRQSDWDFALAIAAQNGWLLISNAGTLEVKTVAQASDVNAVKLSYGRNVIDADLAVDGRRQFKQTTAQAWVLDEDAVLAKQGQSTVKIPGDKDSDALAAAGSETLYINSERDTDENRLQQLADAAVSRQKLATVRGTITVQGRSDIKIASWVQLQGFGSSCNGSAFVAGIFHAVSRGNWLTTLQIGIHSDAAPQPETEPAAPPGLHVGKVVALFDDDQPRPELVKVSLPFLGEKHDGLWARLSSADAGAERGLVLRPEVGDYVVVGFIDANSAEAVVLGSLYSSNKPSLVTAESDDNHQKQWQSKSGLQLAANDDSKSLTVSTPGKRSASFHDGDEAITVQDDNGNQLVMGNQGIDLKTAKDITLSADGNIVIEANNITIKARSALKAKGQSSANFESGGNTAVKGQLVNIN